MAIPAISIKYSWFKFCVLVIHVLGYLICFAGASENKIRVRIAESTPTVLIRGFDLQIYETQPLGHKMIHSPNKTSEWELKCQDGRIQARQLYSPEKKTLLNLQEPVILKTPVGFLNYMGQPYREELQIYSVGSFCDVINRVDLEKYLDGLVNSEFSSQWSEESVAAQVIAARTYAFYQMKESKNHYDLDATVKDQVYNGFMREDFHSSRVVEKTKGMILVAKGANSKQLSPLKAFYHSTCGGITEVPEHVWGSSYSGFKHSVQCPYCVHAPKYHWSLDLRHFDVVESIIKGFAREGGSKRDVLTSAWPKNAKEILKTGRLLDIRVKSFDSSERASQVITVWAKGKELVELPVSGSHFRDWIGVTRLKSTWFQANNHGAGNGSQWHFEGRGNGHGVGMCQWGAKAMGEKGYDSVAILKFYYPDAILHKMW